jgi:hypothetical protein
MCEATVSRLHHDLKIIGSLREGDRVRCADGFLAISRPTLLEALARWTRGENRQQSVACVAHTLFDALTLVEQAAARGSALDDGTRSMVRRFVLELHQALRGLRCLWVTYGDDPSIQARIMVLRESTMDRVANLKRSDLAACGVARGARGFVAGGGVGSVVGAEGEDPKIVEIGEDDEEQGFSLVHTALALSAQRC